MSELWLDKIAIATRQISCVYRNIHESRSGDVGPEVSLFFFTLLLKPCILMSAQYFILKEVSFVRLWTIEAHGKNNGVSAFQSTLMNTGLK